MLLHRILGLIFAAAVGYGLYWLWPHASGLLNGTWLQPLKTPTMLVYACLGLWVAELIWTRVTRRFPSDR